MISKTIERAIVKAAGVRVTLSWVEIGGDFGRGYHEIAYRPKRSEWVVIDSHLSEDEARTVFYLLLQGKLTINPKVCAAWDGES